MAIITFDLQGKKKLFAFMKASGFPDISRISGTFLFSGAFLRLSELFYAKMSILLFDLLGARTLLAK